MSLCESCKDKGICKFNEKMTVSLLTKKKIRNDDKMTQKVKDGILQIALEFDLQHFKTAKAIGCTKLETSTKP